jgi:pantothenate synthetase
MLPPDEIETAIFAGAVRALRRRAARQAKIAKDGAAIGERNVVIRQGESAIAARLATTLTALADELEAGGAL